MEITNFSLTSLRALMDQDEMRQRDGNELLKTYHSAAQVAGKRWRVAQAVAFLALISVPTTLFLLPSYSNLINGSLILIVLTYMALASLAILSPHRRLKKFMAEEENYLMNTWGSRTHPRILFTYIDETQEVAEVTVERDGEIFHLGRVENMSNSEFSSVKNQF